jgi:hypothetical protein
LPAGVWWAVALVVLHGFLPLLRPCRLRLPVSLSAGETESWLRLLDASVATLETYGGTRDFTRSIEIVSEGPPWWQGRPFPDRGRCAAAHSSGKDSLLQAGLLCEMTERPVLVTTTSPMPGLHDHVTARRRRVLDAIARRRPVDWIEVESDLRAAWDNDFSRKLGYIVSVNELCDTHLYFSAAMAAGLAHGATHFLLASGAEVQENAEQDGRIIQHPHCMYAMTTLQSVSALLAPLGVCLSSLTCPLHSFQVQELLWTRYRDLRDLQYSCWRVGLGEATCSECVQCLRIAACALALGDRPALMGIDLVKLLRAQADYQPTAPREGTPGLLPRQAASASLHGSLHRNILAARTRRVLYALARDNPLSLFRREGWEAVRAYLGLRGRVAARPPGPRPGYRAGFLRLVDPLLRDRLEAILRVHFPPGTPAAEDAVLRRSEQLTDWIRSPLAGLAVQAA